MGLARNTLRHIKNVFIKRKILRYIGGIHVFYIQKNFLKPHSILLSFYSIILSLFFPFLILDFFDKKQNSIYILERLKQAFEKISKGTKGLTTSRSPQKINKEIKRKREKKS